MRRREIFALTIGLLLSIVACEKKPPPEFVPNIPPETHLFIEGTVDTVGARQHLYWWGNDPDGYIKGFYLAVDDTSEKFWTERHDSTFVFESGSTVVVHRFYAWAVDNEDLADTSPAVLTLPVVNTPPTVQIVDQSVPRDTILPVLTLYFEGHDIDGDETIEGYLYRTDLDGEDEWTELGPEADHVTLFDLPSGERTFYIRAWDNAGALSNVDSCLFVVGEVRGDFLLVDDELGDDGGSFYREVLDSLGIEYTVFKIEMGLPYSSFDVDYILNQMGFSCLLWYTGDSSHVSGAQGALVTYLDNGGKLLLTSKAVLSHPLSDFARDYLHVDTLTYNDLVFLTQYSPDHVLHAQLSGYPDTLKVSEPIVSRLDGFEPDSAASAAYRLPESSQWGPTCLALRYPKEGEPARLLFFTVPIYLLDGFSNARELVAHILISEFGLSKF